MISLIKPQLRNTGLSIAQNCSQQTTLFIRRLIHTPSTTTRTTKMNTSSTISCRFESVPVLMNSKRLFGSTLPTYSRYPAVNPRISRYQHAKNMRRIYFIKKRLQDKYKQIGRDKRTSPFSPVKKATRIAQDPEEVANAVAQGSRFFKRRKEPFRLARYLAYPGRVVPPELKKGGGSDAIQTVLNEKENVEFVAPTRAKETRVEFSGTRHVTDIRNRTTSSHDSESSDQETENKSGVTSNAAEDSVSPSSVKPGELALPEKVVPALSKDHATLTASSSEASKDKDVSELAPEEPKTHSAPYYQFGLSPSELQFLFETTPSALAKKSKTQSQQAHHPYQDQLELLRRILSLENAGSAQLKKFNVRRMVELFQRSVNDTGSPEVQAAVLTVHIEDMRNHLSIHRKDTKSLVRVEVWEKQRKKILQYLRRKNLAKFVDTCLAIGVDPDSIRAKA